MGDPCPRTPTRFHGVLAADVLEMLSGAEIPDDISEDEVPMVVRDEVLEAAGMDRFRHDGTDAVSATAWSTWRSSANLGGIMPEGAHIAGQHGGALREPQHVPAIQGPAGEPASIGPPQHGGAFLDHAALTHATVRLVSKQGGGLIFSW